MEGFTRMRSFVTWITFGFALGFFGFWISLKENCTFGAALEELEQLWTTWGALD
jgi:hypothetical protein